MYPDLAKKVIVITGAAGALGQGVATFFHAAKAELALIDRTHVLFERAFEGEMLKECLLGTIDLTQRDQVEEVVTRIMEEYGQIDVLVNIAGGYSGGKNTIDTDEDTWDFMMNLNAKSVFLMSSAVVKHMVAQGKGGRIINIGAKPGLHGTKNHVAYSASKSAVLRITESMALEFKEHGVNVNAVLPSTIDTPANRDSMPNADVSKWVAPASLAGIIGFLASEASRDISGALIPVYGGSL